MNQNYKQETLKGTIVINYGDYGLKKRKNLKVDKNSIRISKIEADNGLQDIVIKFNIVGKKNTPDGDVKISVKTTFIDRHLYNGNRLFSNESILDGFKALNIENDWKVFSCFNSTNEEDQITECEKSLRLAQAMSLLNMSFEYVYRKLEQEAEMQKKYLIDEQNENIHLPCSGF